MFLFKLEFVVADKEGLSHSGHLVLIADSDEHAFAYVEEHLIRHFNYPPQIAEIVLVEKKRVAKSAGYIFIGK